MQVFTPVLGQTTNERSIGHPIPGEGTTESHLWARHGFVRQGGALGSGYVSRVCFRVCFGVCFALPRRRSSGGSSSSSSSSSSRPPRLPTTSIAKPLKSTFVLLGIYGTFVLSHHFFLPQNPLRDFDKFGFGFGGVGGGEGGGGEGGGWWGGGGGG